MPTQEEFDALRSAKDKEIAEERAKRTQAEQDRDAAAKRADEAEASGNRYARDAAVARALGQYGQYGLTEEDLKEVSDPRDMENLGLKKQIEHSKPAEDGKGEDGKAEKDKEGSEAGDEKSSKEGEKEGKEHKTDADATGDDSHTSNRDLSNLSTVDKLATAFNGK